MSESIPVKLRPKRVNIDPSSKPKRISSTTPTTGRRQGKKNDRAVLFKFVEELSWLLSSYEDLDFHALGKLESIVEKSASTASITKHYSAMVEPNARVLVGSLPGLLKNELIFRSNEDIIEFSVTTLGIQIPRWQKKSKYELIGHIVCHTDMAGPERLERLVQVLNKLLSDSGETMLNLQNQRKSGLTWNDVIQQLLSTTK
jgi:hypothetical protein